jgi:hypothetical protein
LRVYAYRIRMNKTQKPQAPVGFGKPQAPSRGSSSLSASEVVRLSHPIKIPPGMLSQTALQLKALEPRKDLIGELFPRAYQLLCEEKNFLFGGEVRELAFIETHGRRWRAGEGFDYSK